LREQEIALLAAINDQNPVEIFRVADVIFGQKMDDITFRNEVVQLIESIKFYGKWRLTRIFAKTSLQSLVDLIWRQIGILRSQPDGNILTNTHHNISHMNIGLINGGVILNVKYAVFGFVYVYLPALIGFMKFSFIISGNTAKLTNEVFAN
jgi:hypothetical protein